MLSAELPRQCWRQRRCRQNRWSHRETEHCVKLKWKHRKIQRIHPDVWFNPKILFCSLSRFFFLSVSPSLSFPACLSLHKITFCRLCKNIVTELRTFNRNGRDHIAHTTRIIHFDSKINVNGRMNSLTYSWYSLQPHTCVPHYAAGN